MKIRTRILASATVALAATLAAVVLLWIGATRSIAADAEQEKTQATMRSIAAMLTLSQEFSRRFEPRAAEQWQQAHAQLTMRLADEVQSGNTSAARHELRASAAELPELLEPLKALALQPHSEFAERRRELLTDQLLVRTQELADTAYRWSREAASAEQQARRALRIGGAGALALLLLTTLAQPILIWRRVIRPLATLEAAASAIERGEGAARCNSLARDELGALSRRFDSMADALGQRDRELRFSNETRDGEIEARRLSQQRLQAIADNVPALITHCDADCRYTFINGYLQRAVNRDPASLIGQTIRQAWGGRLDAELRPHIDSVLAGRATRFETALQIGGEQRDFQTDYIPDLASNGVVRGFYGISFDLTSRKRSEQELALSTGRLRTITDNLPVLIAYIDREHRYRFVNSTHASWFGVEAAAVQDQPVVDVIGAQIYAQRRPWIDCALRGERVEFDQITALPTGERHLHCVYIPHRENGAVVGLYAMVSDVTAIKATEARLEQLASFDSLTGLPNRHQFTLRLDAAMAGTRTTRMPMALVFLDIDHFKSINDSFGHAAGDSVLREFALRVQAAIRTTDTVARLGGDEFVVVLTSLQAPGEAEDIARGIVAAIRTEFVVGGQRLRVTTSMGVALFEGDEASASELMARADLALYEAKAAGRNSYRVGRQPVAA